MKLNHRMKGFTLMEMLISILLIALLSSVVVFSSVEMTKTAEASRIINNLYTLKNAVFAWYKEHLEYIDVDGKIKLGKDDTADFIQNKSAVLNDIAKYVEGDKDFKIKTKIENNATRLSNGGEYGVFYLSKTNNNHSAWYVGYHLTYTERYTGIREKIRTQGRAVNVWVGGDRPDTSFTVGNTNEKGVWLKVFGDNDWEKN